MPCWQKLGGAVERNCSVPVLKIKFTLSFLPECSLDVDLSEKPKSDDKLEPKKWIPSIPDLAGEATTSHADS